MNINPIPQSLKPQIRFRFNHISNAWEQYGFIKNHFAPIWKWFTVSTEWVKECIDRKCAIIGIEETISNGISNG